jgi:hypothetical protein
VTDLERYKDLFLGRRDVLAEQHPDGSYRPVEVGDNLDAYLREHLAGFATYGTYLIQPEDQTVTFAVLDIDTGDKGDLHDTEAAMFALDVPDDAYLVEESGRKGWHIWLFFDHPHLAGDVKAWLRSVDWPVPGMETFPKQAAVREGGYGNLVKLPLGKHQVTGKFSKFLTHFGAESLDKVCRGKFDIPPAPPETWSHAAATSGPNTGFPCTDAILRGEVPEGHRHDALVHANLVWRKYGVSAESRAVELRRLNDSLPQPIEDDELEYTIIRAEPSGSIGPRCQDAWRGGLCPGPCPGQGRTEGVQRPRPANGSRPGPGRDLSNAEFFRLSAEERRALIRERN